MSAAPEQSPSPLYNPLLSSVIHDKFDDVPVAVALREDVAAYAVEIGYSDRVGSATLSELFQAQPPGERQGVGMRSTPHFALGKVIQTSRENLRNPNHTYGLRLSSLGVMLELIDQRERGEVTRLHRFGPAYTAIFRGFAEAVLL